MKTRFGRRCATAGAAVVVAGMALTPAAQAVEATGGSTAEALASALIGGGVTVSNAWLVGDPGSAGLFTAGGAAVGFDEGVVLSSGLVADVAGPNDNSGTSTEFDAAGDADLSALIDDAVTYDATSLEVDFVPTAATLRFTYAFGSEEYNEYVGSFNDVFALFVNGQNCAIVPGTSGTAVSINNVNLDSHSEFYRDNETNGALDIEFDGMTVPLECTASVVPGQTNHLKLAVADASDAALDSAVFIKADSVVALPTVSMASTAVSVPENGSASLPVVMSEPSLVPVTVAYSTTNGTAGGSDYESTSGTLTIPPGMTSGSIPVPVTSDSLDEPDETFTVTLSSPSGATLGAATTTVTILDDDVPSSPTGSVQASGTAKPSSGGKASTFTLSATDSNGASAGGTLAGSGSAVTPKGTFVATSVTAATWTSSVATVTYQGTWKGLAGATMVAKFTDGSPDAISLTVKKSGTKVFSLANTLLSGSIAITLG